MLLAKSWLCLATALLVLLPQNGGAFVPDSRATSITRSSCMTPLVAFAPPRTRTSQSLPLRMGLVDNLLGDKNNEKRKKANEQYLAELQHRVDRINELEAEIEDLSDEELIAKSSNFRQRLANGEDIDGPLLEEAFAVVREAAWYVMTGLFHTLFA
jgi:hypothetical protein